MISAIPDEIRERLEHRYELGEYDVDANIEEEEIRFLENVCDDFYRGHSDLDTLIRENMDSFFGYSFEDKLEFAKYIEEHIDEFISSYGVNSFRQALDGGIREYLFSQFFSNTEAIYANLICMKLNEILENIKDYKEELLSESDTIFLNLDSSELEDVIEDFVESQRCFHYIYDKSVDDLYFEFCQFIWIRMED